MKLPILDSLGRVGFVGERKALALLCLGFYTTLFFMIGLSARTELPEWVPVFVGMTIIYTTAFMGVAAEWFWGRWFATGLGYWGGTMAIMAFVTTRSLPAPMVVFGIMHALVIACLAGEKMAAAFDAKPAWREKWKLDEQGVIRVRKSVTRAASSLPALIMFALAPREAAETFALQYDPAAWALLAMGVLAVGSLLERRAYAPLLLGAAGALSLVKALASPGALYHTSVPYTGSSYLDPAGLPHANCALPILGVFAGAAMLAACAPFLQPIASYLLRGRR